MLARIARTRFVEKVCWVTMPAEMTKALDLNRGDQVLMVVQDGALLLEKFQPEDAARLAELKGMGAKFIKCGRRKLREEGPFLPFKAESAGDSTGVQEAA